MKRRRVFGAVLLVVVMLLVSVVPASAGATKTPVSGSCEIQSFIVDEETRFWVVGQNSYHQRGVYVELLCEFDDNRLDGSMVGGADFNTHIYFLPTGQDSHVGPTHGEVTVADAEGNLTWEGHYTSKYDESNAATGNYVLHGVGAYEGLEVRLDYYTVPMVWWVGYVEGEILEPGN